MTIAWIGSTLVSIAAGIVVILVTIGFALKTANSLLGENGRTSARQRVEDFWFRTASLELHEQFQAAMRSRYTQMRRMQKYFVLSFAAIGGIIVLVGFAMGAMEDIDYIKGKFNTYANRDFDVRLSYHQPNLLALDLYDDPTPLFEDEGSACRESRGPTPWKEVVRLVAVRDDFRKSLATAEKNEFLLRFLSGSVEGSLNLLAALPLLLGLYISLNCTLWILSRVTGSKAGTTLIILMDLAVAVAMPGLISTLVLCLVVFCAAFSGWIPDHAAFEHHNSWTIVLSTTIVAAATWLSTPVTAALFAIQLPLSDIATWLVTTLAKFGLHNLRTMFLDIARVFRFDWDIDGIETLLNYAILIDLLFSFVYIVPCLALVLVRRNQLARDLFLRLIQWLAEHPGGPLLAAEEIVSSFAKYLGSLVKH